MTMLLKVDKAVKEFGALRVGEDKMSKSLGNFKTIRAALKDHDAEVLRFFLVRPHYRSLISFTPEMIGEARAALTRLARQCHASDEGPCPIIATFNPDAART